MAVDQSGGRDDLRGTFVARGFADGWDIGAVAVGTYTDQMDAPSSNPRDVCTAVSSPSFLHKLACCVAEPVVLDRRIPEWSSLSGQLGRIFCANRQNRERRGIVWAR